MDGLLQIALNTQTIFGGIHLVVFFVSWPFVLGFLRSYHDNNRFTFSCKPKPSEYIRQRCYDHYVSSLSPLLTPLDFVGITFGVLGFFWTSFIIVGVWFKKQIERSGSDGSRKTSLIKTYRAIFFCHVCCQLAVLIVMVVLFCRFQTFTFPANFRCTQGNRTLSSTNQFPAFNWSCNDSKYKEKSKLNKAIIAIMSLFILLCILTILHLVVTRKKFFEQLLGDITAQHEEQSVALVREAVDPNNTNGVEAVDGNNTQAGEAVDANNTQSGEAVNPNNTHGGAQQNLVFKSGSPSTEELNRLALKIGPKWKVLGRQLLVADFVLNEVEADHEGQYEQCYQMLKRWTEVQDHTPTYEDLGKALQHDAVGEPELAENYCCDNCEEEYVVIPSPTSNVVFRQGRPNPEEVLSLSHVINNWKQLGRALKMKDSQLDEIDADIRGLFEKTYEMLRSWMESQGSAATYVELAKGLDIVGRRDLIRKFCHESKKWEAVDPNNTNEVEAVNGNNTQAGEAVNPNNTHGGEAVDANNTQAGTTVDGNDSRAEVVSEEHLNYLKVCYIASEVLPQGLRLIFKQEWDKRYKTTLGEWQDTQKNGVDFFNSESKASQKRNARHLATMKRGDRAEWDCTMLFYAILYSSSIYGLDPLIRSSVDDLREFRKNYFAHMAGGQVSEPLFEVVFCEVESAFQALGLSIAQIQTTKTSSSSTDLASIPVQKITEEELESLKIGQIRVEEKLREHCEGEERKLQCGRHEQSFCVLPPVPPHQIAGRESDVATIVNKLDKLRNTNKNKLSYFYISGNPGSGKSQLAGLVAKRVYDKTTDLSSSPSFVKTLNAEKTETLLESYVSLATKVSCPEHTVTSIHSSKNKATEEKMHNLKHLIETKISFYERWLLVVDNVTSLSSTLGFLPELGSEQWGNGQLLITTQDCSCIPLDSSLCCHTSISQGMTSSEASRLLAKISGIEDDPTGANNVAEALDYQPLALASAAFYVAKVRELHPYFSWNNYLKKIKEGKLPLTQKNLAKASQNYPKTMTAAIQIAVTRELNCDEEMKHVLTFLAFCAPQPLSLDILTNFVLGVSRGQDKEDIGLRIQGSSLILIDKRNDGVYIRLHQMVHDIVKLNVINDSLNSNEHVRIVRAAVISFNQFIAETIPWAWDKLDSVAQTKHFVGHLKTLSKQIGPKFAAEELKKDQSITDISLSLCFRRLGRITQCNAEYHSSRAFYSVAVKVMDDTQTREGSRELARGCTGLGRVTSTLGFHEEGREHLERALSIYCNELEPDNVEAAWVYGFLGKVERRLGNLLQAKTHFDTSLLILTKLNLEQDNDAAHTYLHLGSVHCDLRNYPEAERNLQLAHDIYLEKFAPRHVDVGRTCYRLGLLQCEMANLPKAMEYLKSARSILLEKLGTEHVELAHGYYQLGVVEFKMGQNQQAKEQFELALSIFLKKLVPDHEEVKRTTRMLSLCDNSS